MVIKNIRIAMSGAVNGLMEIIVSCELGIWNEESWTGHCFYGKGVIFCFSYFFLHLRQFYLVSGVASSHDLIVVLFDLIFFTCVSMSCNLKPDTFSVPKCNDNFLLTVFWMVFVQHCMQTEWNRQRYRDRLKIKPRYYIIQISGIGSTLGTNLWWMV